MTFDEFFKKKRINLLLFEQQNAGLYFEFKKEYSLMGEKSFDHTKKYWFNKLRHDYPLPPEIKTEKPKIENPIAEQTVTESLVEITAPASAKTGFVPRFKASGTPKTALAEDKKEEIEISPEQPELNKSPDFLQPKPAYQPRLKVKPKTVEPEDEKPEQADPVPAKPAYKPRFNMKNISPKEGNDQAI